MLSSRSPRACSQRLPLLGALLTGVLLLGVPAAAKAPVKKKPVASAKKKGAAPPPAEAPASPKSYVEATSLLKAKRFDEASSQARQCIEAEPGFPECHMVLGAALANLAQWDEAAKEYQAFLKLAPDHRLAPKVRESLSNYEKDAALKR